METIAISVIIPVYNGEGAIKKCIESVLNNNYDNFEIIVIDDNSQDNTREIIQSIQNKKLKVIFNDKNFGPSFTRNRGIKESAAETVLLLDSDSYVGENWIRRHIELRKVITADIFGGGIVSIYNSICGKCDGFCNWWNNVPHSGDYYLKRYNLVTNNMSIQKEVFKKIGYFDENLKTGEDVEFCFRALKNKLKIYYKSDLVVYHYEKNSLKEFLKHQKKWGSQAIIVRKKMNMDFSYLMPNSRLTAYLYILPLSVFFTAFIIFKWVKYKPSVLLYSPIIFLGKIQHVLAIKNSLQKH